MKDSNIKAKEFFKSGLNGTFYGRPDESVYIIYTDPDKNELDKFILAKCDELIFDFDNEFLYRKDKDTKKVVKLPREELSFYFRNDFPVKKRFKTFEEAEIYLFTSLNNP
jgi:hypothetical protein